jgi:predicted nucleotidyltransferase
VALTEKMSEKVKTEFDKCVSFISQIDGVQQIYLFGSYAYGEPSADSDIDMYVIVRDDVNALKTMQSISLGLCDREIALDVVADNDSAFEELSAPNRATLQRVVRDKGVLVYGQ